ncbi:uncharacterized protein J4E87_007591 [Alternaria ethzedia]|uniref:uncharacterized protein n=1 Tax=Alternaria ethzedia TaxID=181014 RepID=UPI0020C23B4D|nr:uncharacterized protein J4E87_007591 [Alternaria ethzedia]KAI4619341.1 hypothetical protein J4E87_007591 [Alternaria ethzedia]
MSVGKHTTHWKDFRDLVQNSLSSQQKKPVSALIEHFDYKDGDMDLLSWLKGTKDSQCGDLRDRVYGLMGLVSEKDRRKLPVDYSISKQQLYTGLAMYWLIDDTPSFLDS